MTTSEGTRNISHSELIKWWETVSDKLSKENEAIYEERKQHHQSDPKIYSLQYLKESSLYAEGYNRALREIDRAIENLLD